MGFWGICETCKTRRCKDLRTGLCRDLSRWQDCTKGPPKMIRPSKKPSQEPVFGRGLGWNPSTTRHGHSVPPPFRPKRTVSEVRKGGLGPSSRLDLRPVWVPYQPLPSTLHPLPSIPRRRIALDQHATIRQRTPMHEDVVAPGVPQSSSTTLRPTNRQTSKRVPNTRRILPLARLAFEHFWAEVQSEVQKPHGCGKLPSMGRTENPKEKWNTCSGIL